MAPGEREWEASGERNLGLGGDGSDVTSINTPLASQARVCTYDRVNVGKSDRVTGRHTGADSVGDLRACSRPPEAVTRLIMSAVEATTRSRRPAQVTIRSSPV